MPGLKLQAVLIWLSAPVLQLLCVYLLYRRKLLKQFALLASYLLFSTLLNAIRFVCYSEFGLSSWTYYSVYWVGTALANIAAIAVLYELFCAAFKPFAGLQDLAKIVFKWAAGSILCVASVVFVSNVASFGGTSNHYWLTLSIHGFERTVSLMECALLIFLFVGSQHLGLSMKNRVFGFALGFGFDALCQLLVFSTLMNRVTKIPLGSELLPIGYYVSLLIWMVYLVKPEPSRESIHIPLTSPLLRWNEIALQMGHTGKLAVANSEPFMPQVERLVERVLQKEFIERRHAQSRAHSE